MKQTLSVAILILLCSHAHAGVLYQQLPNPSGGSHVSSWWDPDGSNYDRYVWDAFSLGANANVEAIEWRGTFGASGAATNFTVAIYGSIAAGTQPDFTRPPLVEYETGGTAGQTYAGLFGGVAMYDHHFTLPAPFPAQAGVKYWVQIEGWQPGFPDWSLAAGLGGDGSHFLCEHNNLVGAYFGVPTGCWFTTRTGDTAFTLLNSATSVGDGAGAPDFAISGVFPNPNRGDRLNVTFILASTAPAELALFDAAGRCITSATVGTLGAGRHVVDLVPHSPVPSGIYFVRLRRGGREATTRVTVVR